MSPRGVSLFPAVWLAGLLAGCAGPTADTPTGDAASSPPGPGLFETRDTSSDPVITVSRGAYSAVLPDTFAAAAPGLEILTWVTLDPGGRVAGVLEGFDQLPEAPAEQLARWSRSGLSVRLISLDELQSVLNRLPPIASLNRRAWGSIPQWQPTLTARQSPDRLRIYDGIIELDPGAKPRLLVRGWVEPAIVVQSGTGVGGASPRVRAELVVQWYKPKRKSFVAVATLSRVVDHGVVLEELLLSMALHPGTALVITAESRGGENIGDALGPPVPKAPTLGSSLFRVQRETGRTGLGRGMGGQRVLPQLEPAEVSVLVLVPVVRTEPGRTPGKGS